MNLVHRSQPHPHSLHSYRWVGISRVCKNTSYSSFWPRCLKPAPAALSQKVSGLGMEVFCQGLHCSLCGQWEADGSPTLPVAHRHLTLKQFCWLSLLDASLGTLSQTIRPNEAPHSPGLLFYSPRILCLTPQDKCTNPTFTLKN